MKTSIVLGLGFGDEGKGRTVSYLVSKNPNTLVIRFQGGHQAGHTVNYNGVRHVFSSFGSGTLQGAPTLWSRNCTFYPTAVINEYELLRLKQVCPVLYVDPLCPVTTPFDVAANRFEERNRFTGPHGSAGVGFGTTIKRHEHYYKLYFQDLFHDSVLKAKLDNIQQHYHTIDKNVEEREREQFLLDVNTIRNYTWLAPSKIINLNTYDHIIFEGAQGILLDMDFGFFPNVTRSNTTSKKAMELIKEWNFPEPAIYYVTRTYQTRHGKGFMSNENKVPKLRNNEEETNRSEGYQGKFRITALDPELLHYALTCDNYFSKRMIKHVMITCLDQLECAWPFEPYIFTSALASHGSDTFAVEKRWGGI